MPLLSIVPLLLAATAPQVPARLPPAPAVAGSPSPLAAEEGEWLVARLQGGFLLRGDSDGTGTLVMRLDRKRLRLCHTLSTRFVGIAALRARLHHIYGDNAGPALVDLDVTGPAGTSCTFVLPAQADALLRQPHTFYVTVRNSQFPDGALRGRLGRD